MDSSQKNHLKAYGIAFWVLEKELEVDWLLNYNGGSFVIRETEEIKSECIFRGISFYILTKEETESIYKDIASPSNNSDIIKLEKAPKIAVYSPKNKQPWDDAVTLALSYSEIPYDIIYDDEILNNLLPMYDWLHLHGNTENSIDLLKMHHGILNKKNFLKMMLKKMDLIRYQNKN